MQIQWDEWPISMITTIEEELEVKMRDPESDCYDAEYCRVESGYSKYYEALEMQKDEQTFMLVNRLDSAIMDVILCESAYFIVIGMKAFIRNDRKDYSDEEIFRRVDPERNNDEEYSSALLTLEERIAGAREFFKGEKAMALAKMLEYTGPMRKRNLISMYRGIIKTLEGFERKWA